jgi:hypothetical protein
MEESVTLIALHLMATPVLVTSTAGVTDVSMGSATLTPALVQEHVMSTCHLLPTTPVSVIMARGVTGVNIHHVILTPVAVMDNAR